MKKNFFTLMLAVAASVGTTFAVKVQIGDLYYNLDATNQTAEVTYQNSSYPYWSTTITTANIPSSVTYNTVSYSVTSIGDYAFYECTGLTSVTIPNSVTSIGSGAFAECTGLTSVTIPNSVTIIESWAFSGCTGLTYVTIPGSVTSIGEYAFRFCSGLTSVTIPNSVTSIGDIAFAICSSLTSIDVASDNSNYCSVDGVLFNKDKITLIQYPGGKQGAYTIPNSVTSIGYGAFAACTGLTSVTIPNSVTSIGDLAFAICSSLTSIDVASDNSNYCSVDGVLFNKDKITLIQYPGGKQGAYTIPNSVTSIGGYAFSGCTGLTSIEIPNSVTSIGNYAFYNCSGLTSVIWNAKNWADFASNNTPFYDLRSQITSFTFGNEVEHIPAYLCSGMSNLTSVTIGNSVTSIGNNAFRNCIGLTSVIWNAKNFADFASNNTPFYDLRLQITSFTFGNEVEHIPANLCNGMSNLTSIEIPNSVTSIGDRAFAICSGLTGELVIPNSVTSIGERAFYYCTGLTSVTIPNSVTSIGERAFYYCTGLTSVTIPNSVTSIGERAFYECSGLTSVEAPAGFFNVSEQDWLSYTKNLNQVTVNGGELTENALLLINRSYKTLQTLDVSGVTNTEFADEAFKGYYNLQQLVLPAGLQKVGYMMVAGCKNLQSIDIPASVEEIEQSAFEDCRSIQSITFGGAPASAPGRFNAPAASASQLRRIGNWAFYNAHELQNLEIPEGVEEIGDGAFYGCTYLEEMVLPSSVQSIGDNCFALCAKLTKITCNAVTPPTIEAKTFFDVKRQIPVYVPDEAVSAYENDTYWQEFDIQRISHMPQGVENVQSNQVQNTKILRNGQILILRGDKVYNAQGALVK